MRPTQWGLLVQWTTSLTDCTQEQKPYGVALPQRWSSADRPWTYDACAIHLKHKSAACARRAAACAGCGCLQQKWRWRGKERYGRRALPFEIPALPGFGPLAQRAAACSKSGGGAARRYLGEGRYHLKFRHCLGLGRLRGGRQRGPVRGFASPRPPLHSPRGTPEIFYVHKLRGLHVSCCGSFLALLGNLPPRRAMPSTKYCCPCAESIRHQAAIIRRNACGEIGFA